ncbi:MAG TPA: nuclear transport factor 2 family protein [Xanthobacteraceae bacterium]|nr:nuclear transport factor 2 family protein [Xanthobacteraceae bacterium]
MRWAAELASRQAVRRLALALLAASLVTAHIVRTRAQSAEESVAAADRALADVLRTGDRTIARKLLSLQFSYTDEAGRAYSRREVLADLKSLSAATAGDPKLTMYGLLATVTGERKSADGNTAFFLDIWAKQRGAWRALAWQSVVIADGAAAPAASSRDDGKAIECTNPCQTMPYRVRSPAEQDVLNAFLAIEKASIAHDSQEWSKHVADEFMLYRSGYAPIDKAARIAAIERQKQAESPLTVGEIQAVRLSVYGDAAAMIATQMVPDNSRPHYRAARVWVRRNGQWLMTISVQTDIQTP